jgi:regulator of sigma E protease
MTLVLAILALGLLVVLHEGGHYLVARWSKMRVDRFSVGFGPSLLSWKKGDTQFQVAAIPLGGFVQIAGMNPGDDVDPKDPRVYPNRPTYQRILTIFAGPFANYVTASVIVFIVALTAGQPTGTAWYRVGSISSGEPAHGLLHVGDRVVAVQGQPVYAAYRGELHTNFLAKVQESKGTPVTLRVLREGTEIDVVVAPRSRPSTFLEEATETLAQRPATKTEFRLGIGLDMVDEREPAGILSASYAAIRYPVVKSIWVLDMLWRMIKREVPGDVTGPIGITKVIKQSFDFGWIYAFELLAMLSVYLGLFNLLPLPALDGGRLAFLGYELTTRRRPNPRIEATVHTVGILVLIAIMILVTFKDIRNL